MLEEPGTRLQQAGTQPGPEPAPGTHPVPGVTRPAWLTTLQGWAAAAMAFIVVATATTADMLVVLRYLPPLLAAKPNEPEPIETAWNRSIARLGIEPVYPPTEDVQVGDVLVVLVGTDKETADKALARRALKIAHVPMLDAIQREYAEMLKFPDTVAAPASTGVPWPQNTSGDSSIFQSTETRKQLPLLAFPGITIQHARQGSLSLVANGQGTSLGGDANDFETIVIKSAETYGVTLPVVWAALDDFCAVHEPACSEVGARRMLMRWLGTSVCAVTPAVSGGSKKTYKILIEIQMVNRNTVQLGRFPECRTVLSKRFATHCRVPNAAN